MKTSKLTKYLGVVAVCASSLLSINIDAATFNITGSLTGDPRQNNPDNLLVAVNISVVNSLATWTIDINSPQHPNIKLDQFFFNLDGLTSGDIDFSVTNPNGWEVTSPATNATGSGSADFMFKAVDAQSGGQADDVTNAVNMIFTATLKNSALWTTNNFLLASNSISSDQVLGQGQIGAHLQSLTTTGNCGSSTNCSNSGFAFGSYVEGGGGNNGGGNNSVPEPTQLALMGIGFLGMALARRNLNRG